MAIPAVRRTRQEGPPPPPLRLAAGAYVTDEMDLFRCVSVGPTRDPNSTALLEDCRTLDLLVLPLEEIDSTKLRIVQPHG